MRAFRPSASFPLLTSPAVSTFLNGRSPFLVWTLWAGFLLATLVIVIAGLPVRYDELVQMAPDDTLAQSLRLAPPAYALLFLALDGLMIVTWVGTAAFLFWRRRDDTHMVYYALTMVAICITQTSLSMPLKLQMVDGVYQPLTVMNVVTAAMQTFGDIGFLVSLYIFPDGRFFPAWTRRAALVWIAVNIIWFLFPYVPFNMHYAPTFNQMPLLAMLFITGFFMTGIAGQVQRYRRATTQMERQQIKWIAIGVAGTFTAGAVRHLTPGVLDGTGAHALIVMFMTLLPASIWPVCLAIAVFRYRLWNIDILINRTLVYTALIVVLVPVYIVIVALLGAVFQASFQGGTNLAISLVATAVVTFLFQPLRQRVQWEVNRLMFGDRDDPYAVMTRLSEGLQTAIETELVLEQLVNTIGETLKLPYVAIALKQETGFEIKAEFKREAHGTGEARIIELPLEDRSELVGQLLIRQRAAGDQFTPVEHGLLDNIIRQAGVVVHNVRLTGDLQRALENVVTAREEERRRLARDLHDGLGPTLASVVLQLDAARNRLAMDAEAAGQQLTDLKGQVKEALEETRRIAHNLRPPSLDELGLVTVLRERVAEFNQPGILQVTLETPEKMPRLPAAVEVAVYRIVQEALSNVARHASATTCDVRITYNYRELRLDVMDNGRGIDGTRRAGLGLGDMRERAEELGGYLTWTSGANGGTTIQAHLPLHRLAGKEQYE